MELKLSLEKLAQKFTEHKTGIQTEEATKTAFVLPFIKELGYDVFDPKEVVPEFVADVGLKKGEKVDIAILSGDEVCMIFECKHWEENLDNHVSQLYRYFSVTKTKFGVLTNGNEYRFYTDLIKTNIMDDAPFLVFHVSNLRDSLINEITKFHKENFNQDKISVNASTLKNLNEIKKIFKDDIENPSIELIKYYIAKTEGRAIQKNIELFEELVPKALNQIINEKVNDRLQSAISKEKESEADEDPVEESRIVTTEEELEGYRIIQAIIRRSIDLKRVSYRDTISYFGILLDDNNRKPICRLHFNAKTKYIGLFDNNKKETRYPIKSLEELYGFDKELLETLNFYAS